MTTAMSGQETYRVTQGGYDFSVNDSQNQRWATKLFQQAVRQAMFNSIVGWLRRRDSRLWYLHTATPMREIGPRQLERVRLDQIKGSTNESRYEFDNQFRPRQRHTRSRWVCVAAANRGRELPPVELIKIDNAYFVVKGHYRISVARALGQTEVDANVTVYAINSPHQ